ncbi:MAG: DUF5678 domain-containing protein [Anaerolineae bacterium]
MLTKQELSAELESMDRWYSLHFAELVNQYAGKAIAVVQGNVVAVAETEKEADEAARRLFPGSFSLVVTVPQPEELVCLI